MGCIWVQCYYLGCIVMVYKYCNYVVFVEFGDYFVELFGVRYIGIIDVQNQVIWLNVDMCCWFFRDLYFNVVFCFEFVMCVVR